MVPKPMGRSHMLFRLASYLKFLLCSTDQHGLHSPFVYSYATQCLYTKKMHGDKTVDVLLGSIGFFKVETLHFSGDGPLKKTVEGHYPHLQFDRYPLDLFFTDRLEVPEFHSLLSMGRLHNDSMVLVDNIHGNPENQRTWNALTALPQIRVSIDLFHCGALFIRREQEKEHFFIRI